MPTTGSSWSLTRNSLAEAEILRAGPGPLVAATQRSEAARWCVVVLYAVAMAWVESAVVLYLRTMIGRIDPYQPNPLPEFGGLSRPEMVREAATLLMLAAVGWLAGRSWRTRIAYTMVAFGVWDIFYYVFLRVLTGWPRSMGDWDILFLVPLPWWGPVLAPICIASLMLLWGTLASQGEALQSRAGNSWRVLAACAGGAALALYVFMADAIRAVGEGIGSLRELLPTAFNWPLFLVALLLMSAPVFDLGRRMAGRRGSRAALNAGLGDGHG